MAAPHNSFSPSIVFGITIFVTIAGHPAACSFVAFLGATSALFSASTFCCMALNLQLVLVYGVNGNKMEKYYTVGSLFICVACNASPWIAGELGWYATDGICWIRDPNPDVQLRWLLATQSVWTLVLSSIEVISFVTILIFLVRYEMRVRRLRDDNTTSQGSSFYQSSSDISTIASSRPQPPIVRYRHMIIRIGLYPLLSCFLSVTGTILDVYQVRNLVLTDYSLRLRVLDMFVSSLRPILYAMLSSTDPSFVAAIRARRPKSSDTTMIWRVQPLEPELESGDHDNKFNTTRRHSTPAEVAEEIRVESIGHQI
ncbi:hypothetical protein FB451DRAFT_1561224 [Mycena latifolia]|nr:hypothetical protein FB451DRAFT_1561224 [Mycena latifolia]